MFGPGFYAITSPEIANRRGMTLGQQAFELLSGGAVALQLRSKQASDYEFYAQARELNDLCERFSVPFIVNDRVAVARALSVPVHIGQEDLVSAGDLSGLEFGLSTHSFEQALDAFDLGAAYIGCGPIYATPTKPTYEAVGLDLVERVCAVSQIPVVAIGGLTLDSLDDLRLRGVRNCAMVRAVLEAVDIAGYVGQVSSFF